MAASTWSQISNSLHIFPISLTGSNAVLEVVPTVAHTNIGFNPFSISFSN